MATEMTQLNARISKQLKQRGDEVFAREGLSASQVVRAVWGYAAQHQEVPEFMQQDSADAEKKRHKEKQDLINQYAGFLRQYNGNVYDNLHNNSLKSDNVLLDYKALRDSVYDEIADKQIALMAAQRDVREGDNVQPA